MGFLIDPGVVVDTAGDTEEESVLKGVVRAERLEHPEEFIAPILSKVSRKHISAQYDIPLDGEDTWKDDDVHDFLEKISRRYGFLLKRNECNVRLSAITVINDFQRGKLPHFVPPPDLKEEELDSTAAATSTEKEKKNEEDNLQHDQKMNDVEDDPKEK